MVVFDRLDEFQNRHEVNGFDDCYGCPYLNLPADGSPPTSENEGTVWTESQCHVECVLAEWRDPTQLSAGTVAYILGSPGYWALTLVAREHYANTAPHTRVPVINPHVPPLGSIPRYRDGDDEDSADDPGEIRPLYGDVRVYLEARSGAHGSERVVFMPVKYVAGVEQVLALLRRYAQTCDCVQLLSDDTVPIEMHPTRPVSQGGRVEEIPVGRLPSGPAVLAACVNEECVGAIIDAPRSESNGHEPEDDSEHEAEEITEQDLENKRRSFVDGQLALYVGRFNPAVWKGSSGIGGARLS